MFFFHLSVSSQFSAAVSSLFVRRLLTHSLSHQISNAALIWPSQVLFSKGILYDTAKEQTIDWFCTFTLYNQPLDAVHCSEGDRIRLFCFDKPTKKPPPWTPKAHAPRRHRLILFSDHWQAMAHSGCIQMVVFATQGVLCFSTCLCSSYETVICPLPTCVSISRSVRHCLACLSALLGSGWALRWLFTLRRS